MNALAIMVAVIMAVCGGYMAGDLLKKVLDRSLGALLVQVVVGVGVYLWVLYETVVPLIALCL